jgi:pilus assembly protein CpaC
VSRLREAVIVLAVGACGSLLSFGPARADDSAAPAVKQETMQAQTAATPGAPTKLVVTVGKSLIIDSPLNIVRVHVANGDLAEAVAVNPKEVLINGKAPGETSLIIWQQNGNRIVYDLGVRMSAVKLDAVRLQIAKDFPEDNINVTFENDTAFVRGTVKDVTSAQRVMAIAASLGKSVNLLNVQVPPVEPQILLKVRFANVDRSASTQLGVNFGGYQLNQASAIGQSQPITLFPKLSRLLESGVPAFSIPQAVNILLYRPDIDLAAAIEALQSKRMLEMLAEPNVLAISGEQASFLAGGEFPFPMVQPGQGGSAISIMWREYGIRLNFVPNVTPRGTIRLKVAPEVSSLDYSNAVTVMGVTVPGLASRRVTTEVELESGQSFVIAGLLDNQTTDSFSKIPGIGSIPVLGKLFQSKTVSRNNAELLVLITPEIVRPIPAGQPTPMLNMPVPFMKTGTTVVPSHPGLDKTGPVPVKAPVDTVPYERLVPPAKSAVPQAVAPMPANMQVEAPPGPGDKSSYEQQAPPPPQPPGQGGGTGK